MTPSIEWWQVKAKEACSPHEVGLTLLDTNPVFLKFRETFLILLSDPYQAREKERRISESEIISFLPSSPASTFVYFDLQLLSLSFLSGALLKHLRRHRNIKMSHPNCHTSKIIFIESMVG